MSNSGARFFLTHGGGGEMCLGGKENLLLTWLVRHCALNLLGLQFRAHVNQICNEILAFGTALARRD